ncbi:MAG TPA: excinuclease ABC subunit UvrA [Planctomycetota bacterium]|jgi:excinuclease ABC subunit A|nr:excinuclease ABC subunit UvrA [Planctomycetota bacterium]
MAPEVQNETIVLRGCRQHNLKGFDLEIPRGKYVVVTGVSGSGKSSLAFDTLFAEGQRRYVESFSAYARQFLDRIHRPAIDSVEGIPPAVAIEQGNTVRSSRSTVGTVTEIHDYVKVLFARAGVRHCEKCGRPLQRRTPEDVADELLRAHAGEAALLAFDGPQAPAEDFASIREEFGRKGFVRGFADGAVGRLQEMERPGDGRFLVVVDRVVLDPGKRSRIVDALEQAFAHGGGRVAVAREGEKSAIRFDAHLCCPDCGIEVPDPTPASFTFNSPIGACPKCRGFGRVIEIDRDLVVPDPRKTLAEGAIKPWTTEKTSWERRELVKFSRTRGVPTDVPYARLSEKQRSWLWDGEPGGWHAGSWWGISGWFRWLETKIYKLHVRVLLSRYRAYVPCPDCGGTRFRPESLRTRLEGRTIAELYALPVGDLRAFFDGLALPPPLAAACAPVLEEVRARLRYLCEVGLEYLTLDRQSRTLSGGEMQRVNLTTAVGSALTNTLFVLDEPSVGLHPRDNDRLLGILRRLVAGGNTAVVVEHDPALVRAADHLIDLGPAAGEGGGRLLYEGPVAGASSVPESATGRYLSGRLRIGLPAKRRATHGAAIVVRGARAHNLKGIDARFPLGALTCVTGVSGSGKSSLVEEVLYRRLLRQRGLPVEEPGPCDGIEGGENVRDVVFVDPAPIGRSPRSTVGTYLGVWNRARNLLAETPEARAAGIGAASLSFNAPGGRCEACEGAGFEKVEMQFLADVFVPCAECGGERFRPEVLRVRFRGKNVREILDLTLEGATEFFAEDPLLRARLRPAVEVGIGYVRLGQSVVALSGGESQRLKLATAIGESAGAPRAWTRRGNLYLFDEPTTGLHAADLGPLIRAFELLLEAGHTLVVVEHNGELIKTADRVIDLGPGAGDGGGRIVAEGTPEAVALHPDSVTGAYLRPLLEGKSEAEAVEVRPIERPAAKASSNGRAIRVEGAREHNLRGVSLEVPQGRLVVVTGPSGSGKSSLAFDVLFAEGQRRYIDTLSPYARQFIEPLRKPDVDRIEGIPPAVAIEQRTTRGTAKTTVATLTEVWHYLRLLFARIGVPHCPGCDRPLAGGTPARIAAEIAERFAGKRVRLLAPVVRGRKGFHREIFERLAKEGVKEARVDGRWLPTKPAPALSRFREHDVEAVVAEANVAGARSVEPLVRSALERGEGVLTVVAPRGGEASFSVSLLCPRCGTGVPEPDPRAFSFAGPRGWCPECKGYGFLEAFDESLLVPDPDRSLLEGPFPVLLGEPFGPRAAAAFARQAKEALRVDSRKPWKRLGARARFSLLHGSDEFEGLVPRLQVLLEEERGVANLRRFLSEDVCRACGGERLRPESRAVRVAGARIGTVARKTVAEALAWVEDLDLAARDRAIAEPIRRELLPKLQFLSEVGLDYLALERRGDTLSGGEAQRLRLAAALGSHLTGLLYVLDEPTIGLHPRDGARLLGTLRRLRDLGNTVVVVEHDEATIRAADLVLDLGPGAGREGGALVAAGTPEDLARSDTATGRALRGEGRGRRNPREGAPPRGWIRVRGAREHNLRGIGVPFPLGRLTCVTGVSGSGKSTLARDVLFEGLRRLVHRVPAKPGAHGSIDGWEALDRVAEVDQSPIGRNPRSVPATYVGAFDAIRRLFAATAEARARGYAPGRFSFNRPGGRCEKCEGQGVLTVEMSFLPVAKVPCDACDGRRFNEETLAVAFKGKTIAEALALTVDEAAEFFRAHPEVFRPLDLMRKVGLGYVALGQTSPTLSGGEAQRLKLVEELGKASSGRALFVLDEPTTGLSIPDTARLVEVLHLLVARGDTLVVIEHNLDLIAEADWMVDLGPGGGTEGGRVVACGHPLDLAAHPARFPKSATASALAGWFRRYGRAGARGRSRALARA